MKIVTTVGTSLISNSLKGNTKDDILGRIGEREFAKISKSEDDINKLINIEGENKDAYVTKWFSDNEKTPQKICAEIASILAISKDKQKDEIYLIATDTVASVLCADQIRDWLKNNGFTKVHFPEKDLLNKGLTGNDEEIRKYVIEGLQVHNSKDFETKGYVNLTTAIKNIQGKDKDVILNITGGYKGIIPIMTILGQLLSIEIKYLYEDSNDLMTIPKLPIQFDLSFIETFASHLSDKNIPNLDNELRTQFDKYRLINSDNKMSGLGQIFHNHLFNDKVSLSNDTLGTVMEYKLFHHFSTKNNQGYHSPIMDKEGNFYAYNKSTYKFSKRLDKAQKLEKDFIKLGDIDLLLRDENNKIIVGEVKAHNRFSEEYYKELHSLDEKKQDDYYRKVKARIEYCKQILGEYPSEYLFIVFKIKILQGDKTEFQTPNFVKMFNHFKQSLEKDYKEHNVKFKVLGLWINPKDDKLVSYQSILDSELKEGFWETFI